MSALVRRTATSLWMLGLSVTPTFAADTYKFVVDVLAADESVISHNEFNCFSHEDCRNPLSLTLNGKATKVGVMTRVENPHQLYVVVNTDLRDLEGWADRKAFEPGNEWMVTLRHTVIHAYDPKSGKKPWEWNGSEIHTVATLRMRVEN